MSVAARVAGWQRRLGGKPGPFGVPHGSGEQPSGTAVQVELLIDGLWVDITPYVMVRDGSQRISITRGQANEGNRTDPSRCSMQINNRDGRFSPRNPASPYYGKLGRNQPIRVSVPLGDVKNYRFWGEVAAWPQGWDTSGTDVWVDLQAAGILRRLGQGASPLRSVLYRSLTSPTMSNPPVAYWPCEDMSGATSIASGISGAPPMSIVGTAILASSDAFVASDLLPVMSTSRFTGIVPAYTSTGQTQARFLLAVPAGGTTNGARVVLFLSSGTATSFELYYGTGGTIGLRAFNSAGASIGDSGGVGFAVDGKLLRVSIELTQSGADIGYNIATLQVGATVGLSFSGTFAGATVGLFTSAFLSPDLNLTDTVMGHLSIQTTITSVFDLGSQLTGYSGEEAAVRMNRLCSEQNVQFSFGTSGGSVLMGPQRPAKFLDLINECVEADMGTLYEPRTLLGLAYRARTLNYNQPENIALSYAGFNLSEVPIPTDDDQFTRNDITVSRVDGSLARAQLLTGALSVQDAPAGVGRYDQSMTINVQSDSVLPDQANWRLRLGTVDEARYPRIAVNLAHSTFQSDPSLRDQLLAIDMGWRITLVDLPPWLPPDDVSQLAIGQEETIDQFQHRVAFNCAPESPYRVAVTDSATLGRADTDGSVLAAGATDIATTISVATTSGPLWTTDAGEFPFDIRLGGERITVTNITGSVSPQSFTCTRSVNGVVKAHTAGADVRLEQPAVVAL